MFIAKAQILKLYILSNSRELILIPKDKQVLFSSRQGTDSCFFLTFPCIETKDRTLLSSNPKTIHQTPILCQSKLACDETKKTCPDINLLEGLTCCTSDV